MSAQLTAKQAALMALLTDLGHIRPSLISLIRGRTTIGPLPLIRVSPGFLGMPGSYAFGWDSIRVFLDGVEGVFLLTMRELTPGGAEGVGEGVGGGVGEVAGGGDVGERVIEWEGGCGEDSDSSSSCCGMCWLGAAVCSCGGWRGDV